MMYRIVDFFMDPIMWFIFSKEGSEWMPIILFAAGVLATSFLIFTLLPYRRR
jgi:hypothetical protein